MDTYDTKIFGAVAFPSSLAEVLELANKHADDRRNVHLWRGQSNIEWPIHSTAYRRLSRTEGSVSESSMRRYEEYLIKHATHQGYRYEEGRVLSDFELLAKLQHYGAATRLIDFSGNALVALWFACSSHPEPTGLLFGVHSSHLGGPEKRPVRSRTRKYLKLSMAIVSLK